jgi:hypothetical protein
MSFNDTLISNIKNFPLTVVLAIRDFALIFLIIIWLFIPSVPLGFLDGILLPLELTLSVMFNKNLLFILSRLNLQAIDMYSKWLYEFMKR